MRYFYSAWRYSKINKFPIMFRILEDNPEINHENMVRDISLNIFYAFAEILMLIFLIFIGYKVYRLNKFNDKCMILMIIYLNLATFGKFNFYNLTFIAKILFFTFNSFI